MHWLIWGTYLDVAVMTKLTTTTMAAAMLPEMAKAINCPFRGAPGTHPGGIPQAATTATAASTMIVKVTCASGLAFHLFSYFFNLVVVVAQNAEPSLV